MEKNPIYYSLPNVVTERSASIIDLPASSSGAKDLKELVETWVPKDDKDEVESELKKYFPLMEKKSRVRPHKSLKKPKKLKQPPQHRGKKRLTSKQRRDLGLHLIDKTNKTFEMFLPIHDLWKSYAQELLHISHFLQSGWNGDSRDTKTETIQNRVRKMDYFGCFLRVTRSRCSEYVGIQGIVIRETKNTLIMVCPDDSVKTIPKMHSEFSFVVDGVGFSIIGNHLHQRPAERAKHNFKKLCLWL
ncbi:ribonuclease P protein subunit p29-like [Portunus trituberculatus]|uniref:ribonuclease P protein subunit p29-like n=1 Tax=Portunus trituberculatus TaxID=210409 RepID=UPI001E1CD4BC|nr:ribonuclease P protein subunit p29-like [Portunus trituberculatus]XP_045101619.1 ribonuclease P protein subunit p29-like [Portunus trituberculatus]